VQTSIMFRLKARRPQWSAARGRGVLTSRSARALRAVTH
jgi:hypothetical protein